MQRVALQDGHCADILGGAQCDTRREKWFGARTRRYRASKANRIWIIVTKSDVVLLG